MLAMRIIPVIPMVSGKFSNAPNAIVASVQFLYCFFLFFDYLLCILRNACKLVISTVFMSIVLCLAMQASEARLACWLLTVVDSLFIFSLYYFFQL